MGVVKYPARNTVFEVLDSDGVTWLPIRGITKFSVNQGENEEKVDTTTYESAGNYEVRKMQVGASLSLEGFKLRDRLTGAQDPGQARCQTMHGQLDEDSITSFRFRDLTSVPNWVVWTAMFSLGEQGGGNNDMKSWACTVTRSGAATSVAVGS